MAEPREAASAPGTETTKHEKDQPRQEGSQQPAMGDIKETPVAAGLSGDAEQLRQSMGTSSDTQSEPTPSPSDEASRAQQSRVKAQVPSKEQRAGAGPSKHKSGTASKETAQAAAASKHARGQPQAEAAQGPSKGRSPQKTRTPSKQSPRQVLKSRTTEAEATPSTSQQSSGKKRSHHGKTKSGQEKDSHTMPTQGELKAEPDPTKKHLGDVLREIDVPLKESEESPQHRATKMARAAAEEGSSGQQFSLRATGESSVAPGQTPTAGYAADEQRPKSHEVTAMEEQPISEHSQREADDESSAKRVTPPDVSQEQHVLQGEKAIEGDGLVSEHGFAASQYAPSEQPEIPEAAGPSKKEPAKKADGAPEGLRPKSEGSSSKTETAPPTPEQPSGVKRQRHGKKKPSAREATQELPSARRSEQKSENAPAEQKLQLVPRQAEAAVSEVEESPQHRAVKKVRASNTGKTAATRPESQRGVSQVSPVKSKQAATSSTVRSGEHQSSEREEQPLIGAKRGPATSSTRAESQRGVSQVSPVKSKQAATSITMRSGEHQRSERKEQKSIGPKRGPDTSARRTEKLQSDGKKEQHLITAKRDTDSSQAPVVPGGSEIVTGEYRESVVASEKSGDERSQLRVVSAGDFEQSAGTVSSDEKQQKAERTESLGAGQVQEVPALPQTSAETTELQTAGMSSGVHIATLRASDKRSHEVGTKSSASEAEFSPPVAAQEPRQAPILPEFTGGTRVSSRVSTEQVTTHVSNDPQTSSGVHHSGEPVFFSREPRDLSPPPDFVCTPHLLWDLLAWRLITPLEYDSGLALYDREMFALLPIDLLIYVMAHRDELRRIFYRNALIFMEMNRGPRREQEAGSVPHRNVVHSGREREAGTPDSMIEESESYSTHTSRHSPERSGTLTTRQQTSDERRGSGSAESSRLSKKSDGAHPHQSEDREQRARTPARPRDTERSSGGRDASGSSSLRRGREQVSSRRESSRTDYERSRTRGRSRDSRRSGSELSSRARRSLSRGQGREASSSAVPPFRGTQQPYRSPSPSRQASADRRRHEHGASHHDGMSRDTRSPRRTSSGSRSGYGRSRTDARESRSDARHHSPYDEHSSRIRRASDDRSEGRPSIALPRGPHTPTTTPPDSPPPYRQSRRRRHLAGTSSHPVLVSDVGDAPALTTAHHGDQSRLTQPAPTSQLEVQGSVAGPSTSGLQSSGSSGGTASLAYLSSQSSAPGGSSQPGANASNANALFKIPRPPRPQRGSSAPPTTGLRMQAASDTESPKPGVFSLTVPIQVPKDVAKTVPYTVDDSGPLRTFVIEKIDYLAIYTLRMRCQDENAKSQAAIDSARRVLAEPMERDPDDSNSDHNAEAGEGGTPEVIQAVASQMQSPLEPLSQHDQEVPEGLSQSESLSQPPFLSHTPSAADSSVSGMSDEFLSFPLPVPTSAPVEMTIPSTVPGEVTSFHASEFAGTGGISAFSTPIETLPIDHPMPVPSLKPSTSRSVEALSGLRSSHTKEDTPPSWAPGLSSTSGEPTAVVLPADVSPTVTKTPTTSSKDAECADREMPAPLSSGVAALGSDLRSAPLGEPANVMQDTSPEAVQVIEQILPQAELKSPDVELTAPMKGVAVAAPSEEATRLLTPTQLASRPPSAMEQESPSSSPRDLSGDEDMPSPHWSDIMSPPRGSPPVEMSPPDEQLLLPAQVQAGIAVGAAGALTTSAAANLPTSSADPVDVPVRDLGASPIAMEEESMAPPMEASTDQEMAGSPLPGSDPD